MLPQGRASRNQPQEEGSHVEHGNQLDVVIANEIANLHKIVQQQIELLHKQAEEARRREKEIIRRQNEMFKTLMQQILARQDDGNKGKFQLRWNNSLCISNYQDGQCQGNINNNHKRKNESENQEKFDQF